MAEIKVVRWEEGEPVLDIELEEDLLKKNRELAQENRRLFDAKGIFAIDVVGETGSGKTTLIYNLANELKNYSIGAIAGDPEELADAEILKDAVKKVVQIQTGTECHLDAHLLKKALKEFEDEKIDILFIENVGNIICPAEFPLGAHLRICCIGLASPHIVRKHPFMFRSAQILVVNKIDLKDIIDFDYKKLIEDARKVNPKLKIFEVSCKQKTGIKELADEIRKMK